jgi:hemerythrin
MAILWEEKFSTGDEEIDSQHRMLFDFLNQFEHNLKTYRSEQLLRDALDFMKDYIDEHFSFEEVCMMKWQCPASGKNKEAHRKFSASFEEFRKRLDDEGFSDVLLTEVHSTIRDWLTGHIMHVDTHLRSCTKQYRPETGPPNPK